MKKEWYWKLEIFRSDSFTILHLCIKFFSKCVLTCSSGAFEWMTVFFQLKKNTHFSKINNIYFKEILFQDLGKKQTKNVSKKTKRNETKKEKLIHEISKMCS